MPKEAQKKIGRPPKPKGEAKDEVLTLRLTTDERKRSELAAKSAGVPLSEWARAAIVFAAEQQFRR